MARTYLDLASPLGPLRLVASDDALCGLYFAAHRHPPKEVGSESRETPVLLEAASQLDAYFRGDRLTFELPLHFEGTEFQREVWAALQAIPFGERASYGELAVRVGRPDAVRAVGAANGRNPISIIVPCHRVVGAAGALTGYAGGEAAKRWLLEHEARIAGARQPFRLTAQ